MKNLTAAQEALGQSDDPRAWLAHFAAVLEHHMWHRGFHSLVQMNVFDEFVYPEYSLTSEIGRNWTQAVGEVILAYPGARSALMRQAKRDISLHDELIRLCAADPETRRLSGQPPTIDKIEWLMQHDVACAERSYAVKLYEWLKDLGKPTSATTTEELIQLLSKFPKDTKIHVWDPYHDQPTNQVFVNFLDGEIYLR